MSVLDILIDLLVNHMGLIVTIILGIAAIIIAVVIYLFQQRSSEKQTQELKEEVEKANKRLKDISAFLDGLLQVKKPKKKVLLRDGFRAMNEYRHGDAIKNFKECLPLASNDSERRALLNLIELSQRQKGDTREAKLTFLEMINIVEQADLKETLANRLGNIGNAYYTLGELETALVYYQQALEIAEEVGDLRGEANQLGNIGNVNRILNKDKPKEALKKALNYYQQALKIDEKIDNPQGQAVDLSGIGLVYYTCGEPQKALKYHLRALEINEKIGNLKGQASDFNNIGDVYVHLGQLKEALGHFRRARELHERMEARHKIEKADQNIALAKEDMKNK